MVAFSTDNVLGVNLLAVDTVQGHPLGQRVQGTSGSVWIYGLVPSTSQAVALYDYVTIDTSFNIASLMGADVKAGKQIGSAQVAIAAGSYGWICIAGSGLLGNVVASTQISVPVIPSLTTGKVDTTSAVAAGITTILGIQLVATAGLTATAMTMSLTSPLLKL